MDIKYYIDEDGDWCGERGREFALFDLTTMRYIGHIMFTLELKEPELYVLLYGN